MTLADLSWMLVVIWLGLLVGRQRYWTTDCRLAAPSAEQATVTALVPARNEAATIERCLEGLTGQDEGQVLRIVVIDDASTDATAALASGIAVAAGTVTVVANRPLARGWSGKLWALQTGFAVAERLQPETEWIWLTDADIHHSPDTLARLLATASARDAAMVSVFARLRTENASERFLVPPFAYFFQLLYPFSSVNHADHQTAAAAGGCILIKRAVLQDIGIFTPIRDRLIDDVALAEAVKGAGHRIFLGYHDGTTSLRPYSFGEFWRMVRRTAFVELRYSLARLILAVAGMLLLFAAPPAVAVIGIVTSDLAFAAPGIIAWLMLAASIVPVLRLYGLSPLRGLLLPLAAILYVGMTLDAARRHWTRSGSEWRGRNYTGGADFQAPR